MYIAMRECAWGLEDVYREMNINMTGDCGTRGEGCGADESEE